MACRAGVSLTPCGIHTGQRWANWKQPVQRKAQRVSKALGQAGNIVNCLWFPPAWASPCGYSWPGRHMKSMDNPVDHDVSNALYGI